MREWRLLGVVRLRGGQAQVLRRLGDCGRVTLDRVDQCLVGVGSLVADLVEDAADDCRHQGEQCDEQPETAHDESHDVHGNSFRILSLVTRIVNQSSA